MRLLIISLISLFLLNSCAQSVEAQGLPNNFAGGQTLTPVCMAPTGSGANTIAESIPQGQSIDMAGGTCGSSGNATIQFDGTNFTFDAGFYMPAGALHFINNHNMICSDVTGSVNTCLHPFFYDGTEWTMGSAVLLLSRVDANGSTLFLGTTNATAINVGVSTTTTTMFGKSLLGSGGAVYEIGPVRHGIFQTVASGDTSLTAVGLPALGTTCTGACTPANDVSDTNYISMVKFPTVGTTGDSCGDCNGPFTMTRATALPLFSAVVRTDAAAITTVRYYIGLASAGLDQVSTTAGANAIKGCYFRFDTGIGETTWLAESSDGTTASTADTTIAVAANTTYTLAIDNTVSGECDFYVNGVRKVAKSTNINADSTLYDLDFTVTTLGNVVRNLSVSQASVQQR